MFYLYILQSQIRDRHYIGVSSNLENRLNYHNTGKVKSTKPYRPWKIIHAESFADKHEAYKREYFLKHPKGYLEKKRIIDSKDEGEVA